MKQVTVFLLIFICSPFSVESFADEQQLALSQLKTDLYRLRDEFDIPAMAVIIVSADKTLMQDTSGLADRNTGLLATNETIFRIGSITKMFTSLAMLILQEDGLLDLEMNIDDITPTIPVHNQWHETQPIKIAHLLEHTAGLKGMSKAEFDHNTPMPLEQALRWKAAERVTHWPPGMHHSYTNMGAGLAEYIIEKLSKQRYESFVHRRIFKPLGMSSASLINDERTLSQLATGYDTDAQTIIPYWHVLFRAFGAINLRPTEMVPFLQLLINRGVHGDQRLISEQAILRMETPATSLAAKSGLKFGYGLGNYTWLHNGLLFHGHGGDADGYLSRLAYNRDTELGYFIVINTYQNRAIRALKNRVEDFISRNQKAEKATPYKIGEEKLFQYSGVYKRITQRFGNPGNSGDRLVISKKSDMLLLSYAGDVEQLLPVNDMHFRKSDENRATAAFVMDKKGQLFFQNDEGNFLKIEN